MLLIERADFPDHWQSVTGSQEPDEALFATALRELKEETGIDAQSLGMLIDWKMSNDYEIYPNGGTAILLAPRTTRNTCSRWKCRRRCR